MLVGLKLQPLEERAELRVSARASIRKIFFSGNAEAAGRV
jgi:hypothetical protein